VEACDLDPAHVLVHHLPGRVLPARISSVALRQQQAGRGEGHADQVPRRRQRRERVGQAPDERVRGVVGAGRGRQEMVGLPSAVQEQIHLLPTLLQCLRHGLGAVGRKLFVSPILGSSGAH
jgi:hypothetical protein